MRTRNMQTNRNLEDKKDYIEGPGVAQLVENQTLDFRSSHDLNVPGIKPRLRLWDTGFSRTLSLCCASSLSQNT